MADKVFNENAFFEHLGGDRELGDEILSVYIVDAPARVESLAEALQIDDLDLVVKFSHALKGISATIRAERVASLAEKIERLARKGDLSSVRSHLPLVREELDLVLNKVTSVLGT